MKNFAFLNNKLPKRNAKTSGVIVFLLLLCSCGKPAPNSTNEQLENLNKSYPSQSGGTLIDAMTGEPSGLISMIAGESASSAISANI